MVCKVCGCNLADNAKKCSKCGAEFAKVESSSISEEERKALFETFSRKPKRIIRNNVVLIGGVITGLLLLTIAMSIFSFTRKPFEINLSKSPYFYEKNGDMYVIYNGQDNGTKLVEDYYDDYCDFQIADYDRFIVLEDQQLFVQTDKGEREFIMDDITSFYMSQTGEKLVVIDDENTLFWYDGKTIQRIMEGETNADFTFSIDEKCVGFTAFYDNEKLFYLFDGKELVKLAMDLAYTPNAFEYIHNDVLYLSAIDNDGDKILIKVDGNQSVVLFKYRNIHWVNRFDEAFVLFEDDIYHYSKGKTNKVLNNITDIIDIKGDSLLIAEDEKLHTYKMNDDDLVTLEGTEDLINNKAFAISDDYSKAAYSDGKAIYMLELLKTEYKETALQLEHIIDIEMSANGEIIVCLDESGTLYKLTDDEVAELAENVSDKFIIVLDDGKCMYQSLDNELIFVNKNGESTLIGEKIKAIYVNDTDFIYYINEKEALFSYKNGKKVSSELAVSLDEFYNITDFIIDK